MFERIILRFGLEELKSENPQDLSGGEKQRLALCVALGKEADYYFWMSRPKEWMQNQKDIW